VTIDVARTFRALRHRNYRLFFTGQGLSLIGTWLQQVAMGWLTYRLTGSALLLGVVAFCANIGMLAFGTLAGVLADRVHQRRALYATQSLMLTQALVLAAITAAGVVEVWHLIVLALWLGTASAFDLPLRQSAYVHLVEDRDDLPNAIALNALLVNAARVIGPALAGILLALVGEAPCFFLNALSFVAVIVAIARMDWEPRPYARGDGGWWANWAEGARYAVGFAPVRALLTLVAILAWTITPYASLMPIFAKDIFGGGPHTLGFLLASAGAGALVSTAYLASRATITGLGRVIAIAGGVSGVALATFAYVPILAPAIVLLFVSGGGVILAAAGSNTIVQTLVEDRLRGRVAGFYVMAFLGVAPVGSLAAGALAKAFGAPATLLVNGMLATAGALWFGRRLASLRAIAPSL
jgi:predicted MFS family arabinose efflux permease